MKQKDTVLAITNQPAGNLNRSAPATVANTSRMPRDANTDGFGTVSQNIAEALVSATELIADASTRDNGMSLNPQKNTTIHIALTIAMNSRTTATGSRSGHVNNALRTGNLAATAIRG